MEEGLVSIIIPMYNAEHFIAQTIESVQAQTYVDWEMILIDDCSTDDSDKIVKKYAERDKRIKYSKNLQNLGVAQTRNCAIRQAEGRYLAFLDSDDLWSVDKLEKQVTFMKEKQVAFCYSACKVIDEYGKIAGKVRNVPLKVTYRNLLKGNIIPCLTVVLDQKLIKEQGINIHMPQIPHEDYALWLSILNQGIIAYGVPEVLASYRVRSTSISGNKLKAMKWTWKIYRNYLGLGRLRSGYYFFHYIIGALVKRV